MSNQSKRLTTQGAQIAILQKNLKDLQGQLNSAHKRISELIKDKDSTVEELKNERQLLTELKLRYEREEAETAEAIENQIEDWPDVLDSKPITYKRPPQPGYSVKEGEKWVTIEDGTMKFEDIEIKK